MAGPAILSFWLVVSDCTLTPRGKSISNPTRENQNKIKLNRKSDVTFFCRPYRPALARTKWDSFRCPCASMSLGHPTPCRQLAVCPTLENSHYCWPRAILKPGRFRDTLTQSPCFNNVAFQMDAAMCFYVVSVINTMLLLEKVLTTIQKFVLEIT